MATQIVKLTTQIGDEVREMTDAEYAQYELDVAEAKTRAEAQADKAKAKTALLKKLGITTDEASLLLG